MPIEPIIEAGRELGLSELYIVFIGWSLLFFWKIFTKTTIYREMQVSRTDNIAKANQEALRAFIGLMTVKYDTIRTDSNVFKKRISDIKSGLAHKYKIYVDDMWTLGESVNIAYSTIYNGDYTLEEQTAFEINIGNIKDFSKLTTDSSNKKELWWFIKQDLPSVSWGLGGWFLGLMIVLGVYVGLGGAITSSVIISVAVYTGGLVIGTLVVSSIVAIYKCRRYKKADGSAK